MKTSTVFKILGVICALLILWQLFIHVLGLFILALFIIGFVTAVVFAIKMAMKMALRGSSSNQKEPLAIESGRRVWESRGSAVLFTTQPSVSDLLLPQASQADDQGAIIHIENDTRVKVLESAQKHELKTALKVKIADGPMKGKVGWIDSAALVEDKR